MSVGQAVIVVGLVEITMLECVDDHDSSAPHEFCMLWAGALVRVPRSRRRARYVALPNKKHLKNVGPIHHCEPPHPNSPDVASGTVARRLRIDVHDANDNDDNDNA